MVYLYSNKIKNKSKTAIIMCTYKRLKNLNNTYKDLYIQTNKNFDFYICENSEKSALTLKITKKSNNFINYNLYIIEYKNKYSIFSRFYLARELANKGYEKIIFIDDDQKIPSEFVQDCYDQYDDNAIKSFYAHNISGDYWKKEMLSGDQEGNYVGGGGLLCSSKIFLDDKLFDCPQKYWILDDLWLSYYIINFTTYKIKKLHTSIDFIKDRLGTARSLKDEKRSFSNNYILNGGVIKT